MAAFDSEKNCAPAGPTPPLPSSFERSFKSALFLRYTCAARCLQFVRGLDSRSIVFYFIATFFQL